ncbi:hypothetical protein C1H46_014115 [Malus baccata]|uniref:Uncharacterized protein n=1 Tax=Malus baccata TaxID=106549 RepID=A0A540MPY3_MALBA|nr:hypothetical protein C1H46_014115 [Malus baccata]
MSKVLRKTSSPSSSSSSPSSAFLPPPTTSTSAFNHSSNNQKKKKNRGEIEEQRVRYDQIEQRVIDQIESLGQKRRHQSSLQTFQRVST